MRKIIGVVLILLFSNSLFAQIVQRDKNIIREYLNKFEGTWMWAYNSDTVILKLKKIHINYLEEGYSDDKIIGCHKYVRNGKTIENYIPVFDTISEVNHGSIYLWPDFEGSDKNTLEGNIRDMQKGKKGRLEIQYINSTSPNLKWNLGVWGDAIVSPKQPGVTLPGSLVLIKQ